MKFYCSLRIYTVWVVCADFTHTAYPLYVHILIETVMKQVHQPRLNATHIFPSQSRHESYWASVSSEPKQQEQFYEAHSVGRLVLFSSEGLAKHNSDRRGGHAT